MSSLALPAGWNWRRALSRERRLLVAVGSFIAIYLVVGLVSSSPFSYFQFSFLTTNTGALVLAAMGQTIVFLLRGFDLSAGATLSLVNVIVATHAQDDVTSEILTCLAGVAVGGLVGVFNGVFVAYLRLQPVVVTLASMFINLSLSLLIMPDPGGHVPADISQLFTGDLIPGRFPAAMAVIIVALLVWAVLKRSRFGTAIYAVGNNEDAAWTNGIPVARVKFFGYTLAGLFYGVAGVFLSAQTGGGDPLVGKDMILLIFGAVILGGTQIGGGGGGCLGTAFAAFTLIMISNLLLVLDVSSSYTPIVESAILVLAVIGGSLGRGSAVADYLRSAKLALSRGGGSRMGDAQLRVRRREAIRAGRSLRADDELPAGALRRWLVVHRESVRLIIPPWLLCVLVYAVLLLVTNAAGSGHYFNSVFTLGLFLAVLGLGQGAVVLTGGLDLSVPHTIAFTGVVLAAMCYGSDTPAYWAIPLVLAIGIGIGLLNGLGVVVLGIPSIVMTLAMNGVVQGAGLIFTGGMPTGSAPPSLKWLFNARYGGFAPAAYFLLLFAVVATLLLHRTVFGRRVIAVGNSLRVARLSGVRADRTLVGVYVLSGFCAALVGVLMTGFSGISFLSMGVPYLLPSIAVVLVGGTLATGGRGHYLGILGGALLLTMVGTLVSGGGLPIAVRDIVYGAVVLGAVLMLRERME